MRTFGRSILSAFLGRHANLVATAFIVLILWLLIALFGGQLQIETVTSTATAQRIVAAETPAAGLSVIGSTGGQFVNGAFSPTGPHPASLEVEFTKADQTSVVVYVEGSRLAGVSAWPEGADGYEELRAFPAEHEAAGRDLTITDLPGDASWVRLRLTLRPHAPGSEGPAPSITSVSVAPRQVHKSLLPSITLIGFAVGNYLVLRSLFAPLRALTVQGLLIALTFALPMTMRAAVPWLLVAELAFLLKSAWPVTKNLHASLTVPVVAGIALLAVIVAAPWVYNLAGDYYYSRYDTQ